MKISILASRKPQILKIKPIISNFSLNYKVKYAKKQIEQKGKDCKPKKSKTRAEDYYYEKEEREKLRLIKRREIDGND